LVDWEEILRKLLFVSSLNTVESLSNDRAYTSAILPHTIVFHDKSISINFYALLSSRPRKFQPSDGESRKRKIVAFRLIYIKTDFLISSKRFFLGIAVDVCEGATERNENEAKLSEYKGVKGRK
jgi:hypothetical protein